MTAYGDARPNYQPTRIARDLTPDVLDRIRAVLDQYPQASIRDISDALAEQDTPVLDQVVEEALAALDTDR